MTTPAVTLETQLPLPADKLFKLVSQPDYLVHWLSPKTAIRLQIKTYDFCVGGSYEYCYTLEDGAKRTVSGVFCDIKKNLHIVFTWEWQPPDVHAGIESLVTWDLEANDQGTLFIITHEKIEHDDSRQRHFVGWTGATDRLLTLCNRIETP